MGKRSMRAALAGACAVCVALPGVAVAGMLDQQQPNGAGVGYDVDSTQSMAQTFTAGLSGALDRVDLKLDKSGSGVTMPLVVEIRNVAGGLPGGTVLASGSLPASAAPAFMSPAFVPIGFAAPASVTAGTQYAIVTYNADTVPSFWGWPTDDTNPYAPGLALFQAASPPGPTWTSIDGSDLAFKTYVVTPTPTATGQRAAALKKCKKKKSKAKRRKCRKKAKKLPL
jgi:hypothetical protein